MEFEYNDGMSNQYKKPACFIVTPTGEIHRFRGVDIPNVVHVIGREHKQDGKWSNATYRCAAPDGTVPVIWLQDLTGRFFPQATWEEAFAWLIKTAPAASFDAFQIMLRVEWPVAADRFDINAAAIEKLVSR